MVTESGPVLRAEQRVWVSWPDIDLDAQQFPTVGADLERAGLVSAGPVGRADARLMRQRTVVDHAASWFRAHPDG